MKKTLGFVALAAALAAGGTALVAAAPDEGGRGHRGRGERHFGRLAEYLGLSEDQKATWKSLQEQHRTEMEPLWQEGRTLHEQLRKATDAAKPDAAAVGKATLALKQHREKVRASREAFEGQLASTLTDEQKTKFEAFKAARGEGRRGGHGRRGGPGRPGPEGEPDSLPPPPQG
jgi:Spy/CpxP family protein refolding chaperone